MKSKTPRDNNQRAKRIVDTVTSPRKNITDVVMEPPPAPPAKGAKNGHAVALGRLGGKKGGPARAAMQTPEQRSATARKAAQARWNKTKG